MHSTFTLSNSYGTVYCNHSPVSSLLFAVSNAKSGIYIQAALSDFLEAMLAKGYGTNIGRFKIVLLSLNRLSAPKRYLMANEGLLSYLRPDPLSYISGLVSEKSVQIAQCWFDEQHLTARMATGSSHLIESAVGF